MKDYVKDDIRIAVERARDNYNAMTTDRDREHVQPEMDEVERIAKEAKAEKHLDKLHKLKDELETPERFIQAVRWWATACDDYNRLTTTEVDQINARMKDAKKTQTKRDYEWLAEYATRLTDLIPPYGAAVQRLGSITRVCRNGERSIEAIYARKDTVDYYHCECQTQIDLIKEYTD